VRSKEALVLTRASCVDSHASSHVIWSGMGRRSYDWYESGQRLRVTLDQVIVIVMDYVDCHMISRFGFDFDESRHYYLRWKA
jgi:hypothetical protein